jgi:hypothetical protein
MYMPITGGCRCGAIRYEVALEALPAVYACHCRDCQTWSGSAFALHAMLSEERLTLHQDADRFRVDEVERMRSEHLGCARCMTRIANRNNAVPGMMILRAGTLERSDEIVPVAHIWTRRAQPWVVLPDDVSTFEETPTPEQFQAALSKSGAAALER